MLEVETARLRDIEQSASAGDTAAQLQLARHWSNEGQLEKATDWLRRAAASGDVTASVALGRHILTHLPHAALEGLSLLVANANESGEAAHLVALFTAAGVGREQSWQGALALVQRSAELGYSLAQAELAFLAGDPQLMQAAFQGEALTATRWASVSTSIDLATWLNVPPFGILSRSPRIGVVQHFATQGTCDWLIARARPRVEPAQVFDKASGVLRLDENRTNRETHLELIDCDLITMMTRARMASVIGIPTLDFELTAVLHYSSGQYYAPHVDFFDTSLPGDAEHVAANGQRVLTFLLYLNDDYEGGETEFPVLEIRHRGAKGDALFFWNIEQNGACDPRTLHAGRPPTRGEKWLLSQWIRGMP